ncbi:MAG: hypothetical protein NTW14_03520 [bacterium]|nr:hypothetical protein [bacterium]
MRKILINVSVFLLSLCISLLLAEGVLRIFVDPMNCLSPLLVLDEITGFKLVPKTGAHDTWGFKNKKIPEKADIITMGDSQTYNSGSSLTDNCWPMDLGKVLHRDVYNLSLAGYGLVQYYYLFNTYALKLHPDQIFLGLYLGNDFKNCYDMAYGYDYWKDLRDSSYTADEASHRKSRQIVESNQQGNVGSLGFWLRSHSVSYRLASKYIHMLLSAKRSNQPLSYFENTQKHIKTIFKLETRLRECNYEDSTIHEGGRIGLKLIDRMNRECQSKGIKFTVVLIPTKELVYEPYLNWGDQLHDKNVADQIISSERKWRSMTLDFFQKEQIKYFDVLEDMRQALKTKRIYPNTGNDHPIATGYQVIAESVARQLSAAQ